MSALNRHIWKWSWGNTSKRGKVLDNCVFNVDVVMFMCCLMVSFIYCLLQAPSVYTRQISLILYIKIYNCQQTDFCFLFPISAKQDRTKQKEQVGSRRTRLVNSENKILMPFSSPEPHR